jgi:phosphoribosylanthranilate isomerase
MSMWVKICANTTLDDTLLAAEAGADAVGFVFAPSKRQVTVEQVAAIVPGLPAALEKIGVFVDAGIEEIVAAVERSGLSGVQLHFDADLALTAELRRRLGGEKKILRVLHFGSGPLDDGTLARLTDPSVDAVLVDSRTSKGAGGTGEAFDWIAASRTLFREATERGIKLVVAGGLGPENVAEAIRVLNPWGVDVASGVEAAPGRKDPAKVRAFVANARGVPGIKRLR